MPVQAAIDFLSHIYSTHLSTGFPRRREMEKVRISTQQLGEGDQGGEVLITDEVEYLLRGALAWQNQSVSQLPSMQGGKWDQRPPSSRGEVSRP